jgi:hypothetical protein
VPSDHRRTQGMAAHALEAVPITCGDDETGMQIEPVPPRVTRAERRRRDRVEFGPAPSNRCARSKRAQAPPPPRVWRPLSSSALIWWAGRRGDGSSGR